MSKQKMNQNGAGDDAPEALAGEQDEESIVAEAAATDGASAESSVGGSDAKVAAAAEDAPGAPPAEPTPEQVIAQMQGELEAEAARYAELHDKFQRSAAEFQNSRRRQEKQTAEAIERASTHVIRRLLPVLDDLGLAFEKAPESIDEAQAAWVEGFRQIQRKLLAVLEDEGVKPIPSDGAFDPTLHEAVSSEPNDSVPSGHIISTLRVGYEQRGHVLRPALVRVAA